MSNSVIDIFKIGIGPSSSHTIGPMKAGKQFVDDLRNKKILFFVQSITVNVYGSLSLTGKGHATDIAIIMGLAGNLPDTIDIDSIHDFIDNVKKTQRLLIDNGQHEISFLVPGGINFCDNNLPLHENGMIITAFSDHKSELYKKTYYSIGGGFIVDEENFGKIEQTNINIPYPYSSAADLQKHCKNTGLSLSKLVMKNELTIHTQEEIELHFANVWNVMQQAIERGINTSGYLPGPFKVPRRASSLKEKLLRSNIKIKSDPMIVIDWINMFALAVNEENAAGGRVVTAPTNGACGIIPAVLSYYNKFIAHVDKKLYIQFFLVAGVIGTLYKMNASISGAEVGCQGEVGVACSMASGALAELMGGTPEQVCIAAEIGMEHHLGLTCDPVGGQVQIPCIERNAIAAVKAINAARMAISRVSDPCVSLDKVIETMYQTGKDMNDKYRETSKGGLAIKIITNK